MNSVVIFFPDTTRLSEFVINQKISNAEVNSNDSSLSAPLEEDDILIACNQYEGHVSNGSLFAKPTKKNN